MPYPLPDSLPSLNELAQLSRAAKREAYQLVLVESQHCIEEALKAGLSIQWLLLREDSTTDSWIDVIVANTAISPLALSAKQLAKVSSTETPPRAIGIFKLPQTTQDTLDLTQPTLVLDGIQDPGNVGTLLRSAQAFGLTQIAWLPETVDRFHTKLIRSSAGLVFHGNHLKVSQPFLTAIPEWLSQGWHVYLSSGVDSAREYGLSLQTYRKEAFQAPAMVCVSQEGQGVFRHPGFLEMLQTLSESQQSHLHWVTIPTDPQVESLNAAIAGSLLMAEISHQLDWVAS